MAEAAGGTTRVTVIVRKKRSSRNFCLFLVCSAAVIGSLNVLYLGAVICWPPDNKIHINDNFLTTECRLYARRLDYLGMVFGVDFYLSAFMLINLILSVFTVEHAGMFCQGVRKENPALLKPFIKVCIHVMLSNLALSIMLGVAVYSYEVKGWLLSVTATVLPLIVYYYCVTLHNEMVEELTEGSGETAAKDCETTYVIECPTEDK